MIGLRYFLFNNVMIQKFSLTKIKKNVTILESYNYINLTKMLDLINTHYKYYNNNVKYKVLIHVFVSSTIYPFYFKLCFILSEYLKFNFFPNLDYYKGRVFPLLFL